MIKLSKLKGQYANNLVLIELAETILSDIATNVLNLTSVSFSYEKDSMVSSIRLQVSHTVTSAIVLVDLLYKIGFENTKPEEGILSMYARSSRGASTIEVEFIDD